MVNTEHQSCLLTECEKPFFKEPCALFCPECHTTNYNRNTCSKCGLKFTEHICIDCGFVWYCPLRRYENHTLWNHKYCPHCHFHHTREENLVDNPTTGFKFTLGYGWFQS